MKKYSLIISIFLITFCNAQENVIKPNERKVDNSNELVKDVKLIYHFEYHLSLPQRMDRYTYIQRKNKQPFSFEREFANRIQGDFNASPSPQKPGPKPLQWSPLIVIDGIKH